MPAATMKAQERWKKIRQLGKGSFGRVWIVRDQIDGQLYVEKEVLLDPRDKKARAKALAEVHFLRKLKHPFITSVLTHFENEPGSIEESVSIIMEYVEGGDLAHKIKEQQEKNELWPESQILEWFVQMCLALKHVHNRKILHRDIKTQNIFVTADNKFKLGDFGASRSLADTLAQAKTVIGTPYYLSPELCMAQKYNARSDIWSLGVVLYEMVALRRPFDGRDIVQLMKAIVHGKAPPPPAIYSHDMLSLLNKLLQKDPTLRPSIDKILRLPFLQMYIKRTLPPDVYQDEFAHTMIHSQRPTVINVTATRHVEIDDDISLDRPYPASPTSTNAALQHRANGVDRGGSGDIEGDFSGGSDLPLNGSGHGTDQGRVNGARGDADEDVGSQTRINEERIAREAREAQEAMRRAREEAREEGREEGRSGGGGGGGGGGGDASNAVDSPVEPHLLLPSAQYPPQASPVAALAGSLDPSSPRTIAIDNQYSEEVKKREKEKKEKTPTKPMRGAAGRGQRRRSLLRLEKEKAAREKEEKDRERRKKTGGGSVPSSESVSERERERRGSGGRVGGGAGVDSQAGSSRSGSKSRRRGGGVKGVATRRKKKRSKDAEAGGRDGGRVPPALSRAQSGPPVCFRCEKDLSSGNHVEAEGIMFHPECFVCDGVKADDAPCRASILNGYVFQHESNERLCVSCDDALQAKNPEKWVCIACTFKNKGNVQACQLCRTERVWTDSPNFGDEEYNRCVRCNLLITEGEEVMAENENFHAECFKCAGCDGPMIDGYILSSTTRPDVPFTRYCKQCEDQLASRGATLRDTTPASSAHASPSTRGGGGGGGDLETSADRRNRISPTSPKVQPPVAPSPVRSSFSSPAVSPQVPARMDMDERDGDDEDADDDYEEDFEDAESSGDDDDSDSGRYQGRVPASMSRSSSMPYNAVRGLYNDDKVVQQYLSVLALDSDDDDEIISSGGFSDLRGQSRDRSPFNADLGEAGYAKERRSSMRGASAKQDRLGAREHRHKLSRDVPREVNMGDGLTVQEPLAASASSSLALQGGRVGDEKQVSSSSLTPTFASHHSESSAHSHRSRSSRGSQGDSSPPRSPRISPSVGLYRRQDRDITDNEDVMDFMATLADPVAVNDDDEALLRAAGMPGSEDEAEVDRGADDDRELARALREELQREDELSPAAWGEGSGVHQNVGIVRHGGGGLSVGRSKSTRDGHLSAQNPYHNRAGASDRNGGGGSHDAAFSPFTTADLNHALPRHVAGGSADEDKLISSLFRLSPHEHDDIADDNVALDDGRGGIPPPRHTLARSSDNLNPVSLSPPDMHSHDTFDLDDDHLRYNSNRSDPHRRSPNDEFDDLDDIGAYGYDDRAQDRSRVDDKDVGMETPMTRAERMRLKKQEAADQRAAELRAHISKTYRSNSEIAQMNKQRIRPSPRPHHHQQRVPGMARRSQTDHSRGMGRHKAGARSTSGIVDYDYDLGGVDVSHLNHGGHRHSLSAQDAADFGGMGAERRSRPTSKGSGASHSPSINPLSPPPGMQQYHVGRAGVGPGRNVPPLEELTLPRAEASNYHAGPYSAQGPPRRSFSHRPGSGGRSQLRSSSPLPQFRGDRPGSSGRRPGSSGSRT